MWWIPDFLLNFNERATMESNGIHCGGCFETFPFKFYNQILAIESEHVTLHLGQI